MVSASQSLIRSLPTGRWKNPKVKLKRHIRGKFRTLTCGHRAIRFVLPLSVNTLLTNIKTRMSNGSDHSCSIIHIIRLGKNSGSLTCYITWTNFTCCRTKFLFLAKKCYNPILLTTVAKIRLVLCENYPGQRSKRLVHETVGYTNWQAMYVCRLCTRDDVKWRTFQRRAYFNVF